MAEPNARPQLTVVDETFAAMAAPKDAAEKQRLDGERKICKRYEPEMLKRWEAKALKSFNVKSFAELHQVNVLRAELKDRPTHSELGHAKHASRGFALAVGGVIGAALMLAAGSIWLANYAGQMNETMHESALTGAAIQQLNPPRVCTPGERLQDGRVCPSMGP